MTDENAQLLAPKIEASSAPKDLRAELHGDLTSAFNANLSAVEALPKAVSDSLVALLGLSDPVPGDVIEALGLEDPTEPEVPNE